MVELRTCHNLSQFELKACQNMSILVELETCQQLVNCCRLLLFSTLTTLPANDDLCDQFQSVRNSGAHRFVQGGVDTFFRVDDVGDFLGISTKDFPFLGSGHGLRWLIKTGKRGSLNREGWVLGKWEPASQPARWERGLKNIEQRFHQLTKNIWFYFSSLYLYNVVMDLD